MERLWLPDFLRGSEAARQALGVLVPGPLTRRKYLSPGTYESWWREKLAHLLQKDDWEWTKDCLESLNGDLLASLGSQRELDLNLYLLMGHPKVRDLLEPMLDYLKKPSLKHCLALKKLYPDDGLEKLSPSQERQEQLDLSIDSLVDSLG